MIKLGLGRTNEETATSWECVNKKNVFRDPCSAQSIYIQRSVQCTVNVLLELKGRTERTVVIMLC